MRGVAALTTLLAVLATPAAASPLDRPASLDARASTAQPPPPPPPPQQQQPDLPTLSACSQQCLAETLATGICRPTDAACLCTSEPFAHAASVCLAANCTVVDALESKRYSAISCTEPVHDDGGLTRAISWAMFVIATVGVIARFVSRMPTFKGSGFGWDDWTILLCWLVLVPADIILDLMTREGLGQDIWMLPAPDVQITKILFMFFVSEYTYVVEIALVKVSILLLYLRMWPDSRGRSPWFRRSCFIMMALLVSFTLVCLVVLGLQCQPLSFSWTKWDGQHAGSCIDLKALIFATASLNIVFDMMTILLPLPKLWSLSIPTRKKIAVVLTFSIGLVVTLCSIIRLRTLAVWGENPNVTYQYNPIAIYSNVEINLGVVCACMPAVAGLLQRTYSAVTGKKFTTYGKNSAMMKSQDRKQDRNYEVRLHSFSDGTVKFHGYNGSSAKEPVVRELPASRTSSESECPVSPLQEPALPSAHISRAPPSVTPDAAVQSVIDFSGYSALANLKK